MQTGPDWVMETPAASWQPRDSQGELVFNNSLWIFGGWFDSFEAPPRDVWNSRDGRRWNLVTKAAPWLHSDLPMSITFKKAMWLMGGWYNGRLPGHSASNAVWTSKDGANWIQVTAHAAWSARIAAAVVEFRGGMWLLGGSEDYYFGDERSLKNDVWYSKDGRIWTLVTGNAGWAPRAYHQAVVYDGKIWIDGGSQKRGQNGAEVVPIPVLTLSLLMGGFAQNGPEPSRARRCWARRSEPLTARTVLRQCGKRERRAKGWGAKMAPSLGASNIWIFGGGNYVPSYQAFNDVWSSEDGLRWTQATANASWPRRLWFSAAVYRGRMWVLGGWSRVPETNWGDAWFSSDGKEWIQLRSKVIWKARHEHSAFVFKDKLWIAGGHAKPLSNEVRSLHLPPDFFVTEQ